MYCCLVNKYEQLVIIICIFCFSNRLLDDPDTQVTMKTLGLMRNLLSGREVLLLFDFSWGSRGTVVGESGSGGVGEGSFLFSPFPFPPPYPLGSLVAGYSLRTVIIFLYPTFTLYSFRKILSHVKAKDKLCFTVQGKKFLGSEM